MNESLKSLAASYAILKAVVQPFTSMDAYKVGLIDQDGKKLRNASTNEEKLAISTFNRIVINIKRIVQKVIGKSALSKALIVGYLIKEGKEEDESLSIFEVIDKHYCIPMINEVEEEPIYISEFDVETFSRYDIDLNELLNEWGDE